MYIARPDRTSDRHAREVVSAAGIATLFSSIDGLRATTLPVLWRDDDTVVAHFARANDHWHHLDGAPVLLVATAPDAYISPSWYAAKTEHGRVVPTWNYSSVQLSGVAHITHDADEILSIVEALTTRHEGGRTDPWAVSDAPESYVAQQLKAIVGITVTVDEANAKAKWSAARSEADRDGVLRALDVENPSAATEMRSADHP
ncbi:FMN-binding negative transcriptional regulator [Gordonia sp. TBRC 11910]|uniref:FMN-binding negative transcriptional regulator n=1 Tax=Gordonia asplenii TaxID=2725283 RepID=A0A848L1Z9_9ACTN|nr:FMN-binding negative transcriptional regulator [Gordonia asplenii]NMO04749.1 FMN-binding negative transcriptional regulator [Gordonia asplenii]